MKKIVLSIALIAFSQITFGQDAANKKFQAGLTAGVGMNFQNMGTKYVDKDGVGSDFLIGGNFNYMFNETIGLTSGIEFDFSTSKYKSGSNPLYYYYNDKKIIGIEDVATDANATFLLQKRKQKSTYLTIPTMLIFRTKYIGYLRYFGKFGMRHGFLLSQKSIDEGTSYKWNAGVMGEMTEGATNENMKSSNEMVFYKGSVGVAGGVEWNFTGSTVLVAEIGYYYGITPLYYNRNNAYLQAAEIENNTVVMKPVSNKATQGQLQLKISVLF